MEFHLAPLENVSCWAFRKIYRGASDSYTGMLSLTNLIKRKNTWDEIDTFKIEGQKQWIQIATSKEVECDNFLKKLEEEIKKNPEKNNIYGIQLNCSCPSPGLINIGQGPALIKRSTKVINILRELLKQDKYKIGIKLRLGLNEIEVKQRKIFTLLKELEKIAIENKNFTNVTIHFKHAQESSSKEYNYSLLKEISSYNLPIILNGGIRNAEDIQKLIGSIDPQNIKNIKGIMIGREAMKNPDCFMEIRKKLDKVNQFFAIRNLKEIKGEFEDNCKIHTPKHNYLKTIKERTPWA